MAATQRRVSKHAAAWVLICCALLTSACTPAGLLVSAVGAATDTSATWEIVKHLHGKMTEGDAIPCHILNSVQRALNPRCGAFVPGSLQAKDIRDSQLQECVLAAVVRDPQFWPVLPELLDKGAQPEACAHSPLVELAQQHGCPDFAFTPRPVLRSLQWLAEVDGRAIHHDVVRMLSCRTARTAGLDAVLITWLEQGELDPGKLPFAPLGALHPDYLDTAFARTLEARGHTARDALGRYVGTQPRGFEEALRLSHWAGLGWWLSRLPELANRVPPTQGNQLAWVPLARVLVPSFLAYPASQRESVEFLLAHGANPWQRLPFDPRVSVVQYARTLRSPMLSLLDPAPGARSGSRTATPGP